MSCQHDTNSRFKFTATDYISGQKFNVATCQQCGLTYTETKNLIIEDNEYYPEDYYGKESRYNYIFTKISSFLITKRLSLLQLKEKKPGSVLDIGCGQGWLLKFFAERNWQCKGIEVSEQAAFHAKSILALDISVGKNSSKKLPDNTFDVICLWHVLEHVKDAEKLLLEIHRLLRNNGQLLLGVPNAGSIEAKLGKQGWFHLDVPRHLIHFTESSLLNLLDKVGFQIVKKKYFIPEYDFFSFIQTCQNIMGLEMNLLYRFLRKGSLAKKSLTDVSLWHKAGVVITFPFLAILSLVWVPLMIAINQSSSITLLIEKKHVK